MRRLLFIVPAILLILPMLLVFAAQSDRSLRDVPGIVPSAERREDSRNASGIVALPEDQLDGQFVVLKNRMWRPDERNDNRTGDWDPFPLCWGAGTLLPPDCSEVQLKDGEALGYVRDRNLTPEDVTALSTIPHMVGLQYLPAPEVTVADHLSALSLPGLRYLETTAPVLATAPLPATVASLALWGAPARWDFPWVTCLQSDCDYSGWMGSESVPSPLPENLGQLGFLYIGGWPRGMPLPQGLTMLWAEHLTPVALTGPRQLEWVRVGQVVCEGDAGLDAIARHPCLRRVDLNAVGVTDAGLAALGAATQLEDLSIDFDYDGPVSALGITALARLPHLRRLELSGGVTDAMLAGLNGCPHLHELVIGGEAFRFTGLGLEVVPALQALKQLDLSGCARFTGEGARHLSGMKILARANLGRALTVRGCREIIAHWPGTELSFADCAHLGPDAFDGLADAKRLTGLNLMCREPGVGPEILEQVLHLEGLNRLHVWASDAVSPGLLRRLAVMPSLVELSLYGSSIDIRVIEALGDSQSLKKVKLPAYWRVEDDALESAVWALMDRRPDLDVFGKSKGNYYDRARRPR